MPNRAPCAHSQAPRRMDPSSATTVIIKSVFARDLEHNSCKLQISQRRDLKMTKWHGNHSMWSIYSYHCKHSSFKCLAYFNCPNLLRSILIFGVFIWFTSGVQIHTPIHTIKHQVSSIKVNLNIKNLWFLGNTKQRKSLQTKTSRQINT